MNLLFKRRGWCFYLEKIREDKNLKKIQMRWVLHPTYTITGINKEDFDNEVKWMFYEI